MDFLIVGTSRSGTTLVQRLATELGDVAVPLETHFLSEVFPGVLSRGWQFPLTEAQAAEVLADSPNAPAVDAAALDRSTPLRMFSSMVRELAGEARVYGEKTPLHVRWVRPLLASLPALRVIAVVRHPCAVAASHRHLEWGTHDTPTFAVRWRHDQQQLLAAIHDFPGRITVLRYEDVVADPSRCREMLADVLQTVPADAESIAGKITQTHAAWWGERAVSDIDKDSLEKWRAELDREEVRVVTSLCRHEMRAFGYRADYRRPPIRAAVAAARKRRALRRWQHTVDRMTLQ